MSVRGYVFRSDVKRLKRRIVTDFCGITRGAKGKWRKSFIKSQKLRRTSHQVDHAQVVDIW